MVVSVVFAVLTSAKCTSITTQLVGSVLAFLGLLTAYLRARHRGDTVWEQIRGFFLRLVGRPVPEPVPEAQASGTYAFRGGATKSRPLWPHRELDIQDQIDGIVEHINKVGGDITEIFGHLGGLQAAVVRLDGLAVEKSTEAYQKARAEIDELRREDQSAALDLRWAIFGVYIATIGVALSFWA